MGTEKTVKVTLALMLVFLITVNCDESGDQETSNDNTDSSGGK